MKKCKYDINTEMKFLNSAKWIEKVIDSCTTLKHTNITCSLIKNLDNLYYKKVDADLFKTVINQLDDKVYHKQLHIIDE